MSLDKRNVDLEYRFLTVIPNTKPDVRQDGNKSYFPWLSAIQERPNRLKACIVTGKDDLIGLYLFKTYAPCSIGMSKVMQLIQTARQVSRCPYTGACVHPYAMMPPSSRDSSIEVVGDIKSMLVEGARQMRSMQDRKIPTLQGLELVVPPNGLPTYYLKGLIAEMLALARPAVHLYMDGEDTQGGGISPCKVRLEFSVGKVAEAMIAGEAVSVIMLQLMLLQRSCKGVYSFLS